MHSRFGSATQSQLAFPREGNPNFPWEKSHWDNTFVKSKISLKKKVKVKNPLTKDYTSFNLCCTSLSNFLSGHRRSKFTHDFHIVKLSWCTHVKVSIEKILILWLAYGYACHSQQQIIIHQLPFLFLKEVDGLAWVLTVKFFSLIDMMSSESCTWVRCKGIMASHSVHLRTRDNHIDYTNLWDTRSLHCLWSQETKHLVINLSTAYLTWSQCH